jgi:hypothetical protein
VAVAVETEADRSFASSRYSQNAVEGRVMSYEAQMEMQLEALTQLSKQVMTCRTARLRLQDRTASTVRRQGKVTVIAWKIYSRHTRAGVGGVELRHL